MRNTLVVSSFVICLVAGTALADRNKDVAAALRKEFPDATTEITKTTDVNGVKVHQVHVKLKDGTTSTATITDYGDFILIGEPGKFDKLPSSARAAQAIFK